MSLLALDADPRADHKTLEYELEEARILQAALVAHEPLRASAFEVASQFRPAVAVGADFLDYFRLSELTVSLYLGDVVGKGLPAAFYAALAVGTLRGINKTGETPGNILNLLNSRLLMRAVPARFCVAQYAVLDAAPGILRYSNSGLPGPLHISARGCHNLGHGGPPLGLFDGVEYESHSVSLEPGDTVLFFTDGLTNASDAKGQQFGLTRLRETCGGSTGKSVETLLRQIFAELHQFTGGQSQEDDQAAVAVRLNARRP